MILAIDQGTTGSTALVMDGKFQTVARHNVEYAQIYPQPGWVEHDPEAIFASVREAVLAVLKQLGWSAGEVKDRIKAVGITNQRETVMIWNRANGRPVHNAIVWQCRRTAPMCDRLKQEGHEAEVTRTTGLLLDPYFSGTKIAWLLDNVPGLRARAEKGEVAAGTVDTFLIHRMTGAHVTEISNASRTLLMNLQRGEWDEPMVRLLGVPLGILPRIASSAEVYGHTKGLNFLPDGIPLAGCAGDQQSALFGQACFDKATAKATYGTGSFILLNTGEKAVPSANRMLTTAAWRLGPNAPAVYALEGAVFIAGAAVQWLRDGLGIIQKATEIEALAASVPDSGGVHFVPALTGLGAPHWNAAARGEITGLTRGTTRAHIARATLEGIAYQNADVLEAMQKDVGTPLKSLRVDGGAAANNLLMQMQADILGVPLARPKMIETTALGAAMLAGLGAGLFKSIDELRGISPVDRTFEPAISADERASRLNGWRHAVRKACGT